MLAAIDRAYSGETVEETARFFDETHSVHVFPMPDAAVSGFVGRTWEPMPDAAVSGFVAIVAFKPVHSVIGAKRLVPANLVDRLSEGVITADCKGRILFASEPALAIIGRDTEDVLGKPLVSVLPGVTVDEGLIAVSKEIALRGRNGSSLSVAVSTSLCEVEGQEIITAVLTDNTERDAARNALAKSDARYALVAAGANDGLWEWNLEDGTVQFSARWRTLLGLEAATIKHTPEEWLSRIHPSDVDSFCERFDAHLAGQSSQFEHEYRMKHANGDFRWVQARGIAARRENGEPYLMAGSQSDISDRKLAEESLSHGALHDALTGLPNRGLVLDRVNQALARQTRNEDQNFALAILDLDRFMIVNESLGHAAGDELLSRTRFPWTQNWLNRRSRYSRRNPGAINLATWST